MRRVSLVSLCLLMAAAFGLGEVRSTSASPVAANEMVSQEEGLEQVLPAPPGFEGPISPGCEFVEPVFGPLPPLGGPAGEPATE